MSVKDELLSLVGAHVALCEPNPEKFAEISTFLNNYEMVTHAFNTPEAAFAEIQAHQYSTRRFYMMILIDFELVKLVMDDWADAGDHNPTILQTPVVLMCPPQDLAEAQPLIDDGYFRYQLESPVKPLAMLRLLGEMNGWKAMQKEADPESAIRAVVLER